jgi:hypothetical protein
MREGDKKASRAERERELAAKQMALPDARYGVIAADPEWQFEVWSREYDNARVLSEDYDTIGRIMKVRGLPGAIARLRRTLAAS